MKTIVIIILLLMCQNAFAIDYTFTSGRPNILTNWSPVPPNFTNSGDRFIINSSSLVIRFNEEWIVAGEVIVNSGGTLTKNNAVIGTDTTARSIQIGTLTLNGGTITFSSGTRSSLTPQFIVSNFVVNSGIFNKSNSGILTVTNLTLSGGTMSIGGVSVNTVNTSIINGSGILNITGNSTLNINTMTVGSGGELNFTTTSSIINGANFTLSSGASIRVSNVNGISSDLNSHIRTTLRNFSTGANYSFTQAGAGVLGNIFPYTVNNLSLSKSSSGTYNVSQNLTVNGNLTILNLASLQINAGFLLKVNGNVINNSTNNTNYPIRIRSTGVGAGGQAYMNVQGNISGTGLYRIERFVQGSGSPGAPSGKGNYVSSPISDATSAVFSASGLNRLFSYNESTNNWNAEITVDGDAIAAARGYAFRPNTNTTLNYIGTINNGSISFPVSSINNRWSLVGNPYPCTIDWGLDASHNWTQTGMRSTMWISAGDVSNTVHSYNRIGGVASSPTISRYIAPGQAFWVLTSAVSASLSCNNSVKVDDTRGFIRLENPNNQLYRLALKQNEILDECLVYFNANGENGQDEGDSEKFDIYSPDAEIFTMIQNDRFSIDRRADINNQIIALGISTKIAGTYQISNYEKSIPENTIVYIEDLQKNTFKILNDTYEFETQAVKNQHRFNLHFVQNTTSLNNSSQENSIQVYNSGKSLFVSGNEEFKQIQVFDLTGKLIEHQNISGSLIRKELNIPSGTYIVRVIENQHSTSKKLVF